MISSENSSATRESSNVIILKSSLNFTGDSACTNEVRDIFDRQTYVPNDWWQLMCSNVLQPWDRRNSMTAPVHNITGAPTMLSFIWMSCEIGGKWLYNCSLVGFFFQVLFNTERHTCVVSLTFLVRIQILQQYNITESDKTKEGARFI